MILNLGQQGPAASNTRSVTTSPDRSKAQLERLGPLGRGEEPPLQAVVLGMHRSGTSALTGLLDRLGFYAGPDESLAAADDDNAKGYWEHRELYAINEELLAALGGSWSEALEIDPRRLGDVARASLLPRARALVGQLDSYGPWVIKDPRLCLLLPFWRDLLERPLCILIHRDPLSVARSLARRNGLPIHVGIALWEHYNRAALAASQGLPRVLVGYRELVDDPVAVASGVVRTLTACGVRGLEGLRELPPADARLLLDSSLEHHVVAPAEDLGYLNVRQHELLHALESGAALHNPVSPLSAGAREILQEHARQAREAAAQRQAVVNVQAALAQSVVERQQALTAALQEIRAATAAAAAREAGLAERIQHIDELFAAHDTPVAFLAHRLTSSERKRDDLAAELNREQQALAEREALLAAVFASRSWRLGFGLSRLLGVFSRGRRQPTALERCQSLRDG